MYNSYDYNTYSERQKYDKCNNRCPSDCNVYCGEYVKKYCDNISKINGDKSLFQGIISESIIPTGSNIPFRVLFKKGKKITQEANILFNLAEGHVYLIAYNVKGTVNIPGFISVIPRIDGIEQEEYEAKGVNGTLSKSLNASATFMVSTMNTSKYIDLIFYASTMTSEVKGSISIIEIS